MDGSNDEAKDFAAALVGAAMEGQTLEELRGRKRALIQQRDALVKQKVQKVDRVWIDVGGTQFKVLHDDARKHTAQQLDSVDRAIDALEATLDRHRRSLARAPGWVSSSVVLPAGLPFSAKR